ncbi:hypothetical protein PR202_gb29017 [Eleusine coracana subsp. coracana]|uniref:Uncharacterized protein n=1 Tax=Eleusine coracana subsp. coracana TaxID=191504 RepID=A0AAV5FVY5_ELECO|nr:hypothetical protein PR202_gb29017 [Eleusine coracana subsp. coracana]
MLLLQAAPLLKELYIKVLYIIIVTQICDRVNNDNKSVSLGEVTTASIKHYNLIRFTILGCYNIEEIIVPYTCRLVEAAVNLKEIYVRDEAAPCRRIKKRVAGSRAARRYDEPDAPPSTVEDTSPDTTPHGLSFSSSNTVIIIIGASDAASASSFFDPMHFCYDAAPSHSFPIARSSKELGGGKESLPIPTGSSSYLQVEVVLLTSHAATQCSHQITTCVVYGQAQQDLCKPLSKTSGKNFSVKDLWWDHECNMQRDVNKKVPWDVPKDFKHYSLTRITIQGFYSSKDLLATYMCRLVGAAINLEELRMSENTTCKECNAARARFPRIDEDRECLVKRITHGASTHFKIHIVQS